METLRTLKEEFIIMNFKFSITGGRSLLSKSMLLAVLSLAFLISSCSKKPAQLYDEGMKSFAAGDYAKAQEYFADGIKKEGNTQLYAAFIAANLVTGKYPQVNTAYNQLCENIHSYLAGRFGERIFRNLGITRQLIPYEIKGGNTIPPDFPATIALQASADYSDYLAIQGQIDTIVKK
jgi:hypothetical protein